MRKKIILGAASLMALVVLGFAGYFLYGWLSHDYTASCANCRSFVNRPMEEYAEANDGWYPRGGKHPLDSLAKCITNEFYVHCFTSHAFQKKHGEYWGIHKSFSSEYCCYRYNEGLRKDDPRDMILLYYFKPTRWECDYHKKEEVGRNVCFVPPGPTWKWIPEAEFQKLQAKTLAYLKENNRFAKTGEAHNENNPSSKEPAKSGP